MTKANYKLALVLGGGGAPGLAHLGVLEVLERENVRPDLIVGASIGAIIGALYALEPEVEKLRAKVEELLATEEIGRRWRNLAGKDDDAESRFYGGLLHFFQRQLVGMKVFTSAALRPAEELEQPLEYLLGDKTFADTQIPFAAVTLDIVKGRELLITEGKLTEALYASAAIPGIFPPMRHAGQVLVDGAFMASCPVKHARTLGAEKIIGVRIPLSAIGDEAYETGIDVLARTDELVRGRLSELESRHADLLLEPATQAIQWADFESREEAITLGRQAAHASLLELRRLAKQGSSFWSRLFGR